MLLIRLLGYDRWEFGHGCYRSVLRERISLEFFWGRNSCNGVWRIRLIGVIGNEGKWLNDDELESLFL